MTKIFLSVVYGGPDSEVIEPIVKPLKKNLHRIRNTYSAAVDTLNITLFVEGNIQKYGGKNGLRAIRLHGKTKRMTIDIVLKEHLWRRGNKEVSLFLKAMTKEISQAIDQNYVKKGVIFDTKTLRKDMETSLLRDTAFISRRAP